MDTTFPITIDATQVHDCYTNLWLSNGIPIADRNIDTSVPKIFSLVAGQYKFQLGSSTFSANFTVTPQGTVTYADVFKNFVKGQGTNKLTLTGFKVALDARYLPLLMLSDLFQDNPIPNPHEFGRTIKTWNMLPSEYGLIVGSGMRSSFNFTLNGDGNFAYDPAYECEPDGSGGFLRGARTSKLEFLGFPVLIDARAVVENAGVWLSENATGAFPSGVLFANLLPAGFYEIRFKNDTSLPGVFFDLVFDLRRRVGIISQSQPPPPRGQKPTPPPATIQVKKFHDLTLLVILPKR